MIKLGKECMSKAEIRPEGNKPLAPVSRGMSTKEKFLQEIISEYTSEHENDEKVKQPNC